MGFLPGCFPAKIFPFLFAFLRVGFFASSNRIRLVVAFRRIYIIIFYLISVASAGIFSAFRTTQTIATRFSNCIFVISATEHSNRTQTLFPQVIELYFVCLLHIMQLESKVYLQSRTPCCSGYAWETTRRKTTKMAPKRNYAHKQ